MTIKLFAAGNLFARLFLRASFPLLFSLYILLSLYILPASQHSNAKSPQDTKIQNFFLYYTTNCQPGASAIENRCIQERLLSFKCKRSQKHPGAYNPPSRLFTGQRNISSISTKLPPTSRLSQTYVETQGKYFAFVPCSCRFSSRPTPFRPNILVLNMQPARATRI